MSFQHLLYETPGPVARLTLNRPEVLNALNIDLLVELLSVLQQIREDPAVRVVVLTGAGRGFCAGADLEDRASDETDTQTSRGERVADNMERYFNPLIRGIAELPQPVIAAVNGVAAGGGVGVALAADIVVAARSAKFIQVFAPQLAIIPDMGATWFLAHKLGRARARALALTGAPLMAETAADWGMIYKAVPDDALMDEVMAIAERMSRSSAKALQMTKAALDVAPFNALNEQLDVERFIQGQLTNRADFQEGVAAFREKRAPKFS